MLGDGGFQFTLAELGSARDCNADVAFLVWNNSGYLEIETSMVRPASPRSV
jgi:acetolactate synthase-1/2/3 large subunit